jgi:hypothetical protein
MLSVNKDDIVLIHDFYPNTLDMVYQCTITESSHSEVTLAFGIGPTKAKACAAALRWFANTLDPHDDT